MNNFLASVNCFFEFADCKTVNHYWDKFMAIVNVGISQFVPMVKVGPNGFAKKDSVILNTHANCWLLSASAGDCTGSLRLTDYLLNTKLSLGLAQKLLSSIGLIEKMNS